jgi:ELWxxDGT repeat protein
VLSEHNTKEKNMTRKVFAALHQPQMKQRILLLSVLFFALTMQVNGGAFAQPLSGSTTAEVASVWQIQGFRDFNGDGKTDILFRHANGTIAFWLMDGVNAPHTASFNVDPAWQMVGVGDFNGDGKTDILWQHEGVSTCIWLMDRLNRLASKCYDTPEVDWKIAGLGDFNGDRQTDIFWHKTSDPTFNWTGIWQMDGAPLPDGVRIASGGCFHNLGKEWGLEGFGDFNGDGETDILWRHIDGTTRIWLMDGVKIPCPVQDDFDPSNRPLMPAAWQVKGFEDFNGDGKSDVLWQHTDGTVYVWLMNGLSIADQGSPGSLSHTIWTAMLVKDIIPGPKGSEPTDLTAANSTLYFTANDDTPDLPSGHELWKSDGSAAGTVLVKDINPGNGSAFFDSESLSIP